MPYMKRHQGLGDRYQVQPGNKMPDRYDGHFYFPAEHGILYTHLPEVARVMDWQGIHG